MGFLTGVSWEEIAAELTKYTLVDGTRPFTGTIGGIDPVLGPDLVTLDYLNAAIATYVDVASSGSAIAGTVDAGTYVTTHVDDGTSWTIHEVAATPGFDLRLTFTGITQIPSHVRLTFWYDGSATHTVQVQLWDFVGGVWETYGVLPAGSGLVTTDFPIVDPLDHMSGGEVRVRINHVSGGNASHHMYVDYAAIMHMGIGATADHGALTGLTNDTHPQYLLLAGRGNSQVISKRVGIGYTPDTIGAALTGVLDVSADGVATGIRVIAGAGVDKQPSFILANFAGTARCFYGLSLQANNFIVGAAADEIIFRTENIRLLFSTDGGTTLQAALLPSGHFVAASQLMVGQLSSGETLGFWGNAPTTETKALIQVSSATTDLTINAPLLNLSNINKTTNNFSSLVFGTYNSDNTKIATSAIFGIHGARDNVWSTGSLVFATVNTGDNGPQERMRIGPSGIISLNGKAITLGANDSAGAGYRTVTIENA
jgi:hypothetical protein